jgi:two-component system, NarL family, sensor kinase
MDAFCLPGGQDGGVRIRRHRRRVPDEPGGAPPSIGGAVGRFLLGTMAAILVVGIGGFFALRSVAIDESERATQERVEDLGKLVEGDLRDGILRRDPEAIASLDDTIASRVLSGSIVRVKLWARDGTVLYSDEPAIIGKRYKLGDEEAELIEDGGADAELSDLSKPENRYERPQGKLLEAHTRIRTPNGTPVLFELYERFGSITDNARRLLRALAPPLLAGLFVLLLFQIPLAWSMARRLQRGHREREGLLANAIEASEQERRRIASDLHDGVVQDVAGVAFGLAPLAEDAARRGDASEAQALRGSMAQLRQGVRDLRTLLVEIHPPSLESTGLGAALSDLLSPLEADGIATEVHVDDRAGAGSSRDPLIYRVAREALRNVQAHADARSVRVELSRPDRDTTRLVVVDDGKGFAPADRERRGEEGHVGLTLLESLVRQSHGQLEVRSEPGRGTTVELEVPSR